MHHLQQSESVHIQPEINKKSRKDIMLSGFLVDFSWGNWGMRFGLAAGWFGWANRQVHEEQSRHSLAQGWPEQELPQPGISPTHSRTPPILTSLLSLLLFIIILHEVREPSWPRLHCWGPIGYPSGLLNDGNQIQNGPKCRKWSRKYMTRSDMTG